MLVASHNTRRSTAASVCSRFAAGGSLTVAMRRSLFLRDGRRQCFADLCGPNDHILCAAGSERYCLDVPRTALDEIDYRILDALVEDGRRSASEIGRQINLSPAAAKRRIDRLEQLGVITGYRAELDHTKLGSTIDAFVELRFEGSTQVDDIDRAFSGLAKLVQGFTIAGDPDALVRLRVGDLSHLKRVIDQIRRSGRIVGTKTLIVLGTTTGSA